VNFLAHLLLAKTTPGWRVGSLMPDLVKRVPRDIPDSDVQLGVDLHRLIDARTDMHPAMSQARALLRGRAERYSSIIADVVFDHYLASDWPKYHSQSLAQFSRSVYRDLLNHPEMMPEDMLERCQRMAQQDWLSGYATLDGIELTLWRMSRYLSKRFDRTVKLDKVMPSIEGHYIELGECFNLLWPDVAELSPRPQKSILTNMMPAATGGMLYLST